MAEQVTGGRRGPTGHQASPSETVLCLEHVRLLNWSLVRRHAGAATALAIFEPYSARSEGRFDAAEVDRALRRWQTAIGRIPVSRLTHHDYFDEMIESGEEAIRFLEGPGAALLTGTPVCERLYRLLGSDAVLLALKKGVATYLKDRIHFLKIAALLAADPRRRVLVVPAYDDIFFEPLCRLLKIENRVVLLAELRGPSRRAERLNGLKWLLYAVAGLLFRVTRNFFKTVTPLTLKRVLPKAVQWAKPLVAGLKEGDPATPGYSRTDDNLEDGADFNPSRFLYIHSLHRFPKEKIKAWKSELQARGSQLVDTWTLRMPAWFYLTCKVPASWQRLLWCAASLAHPGLSKICEVGHTVLESYVGAELFMQYYRPKVTEVRDDYLIAHVIRTIVFNRYGCKTIGIQHGAYSLLGLNPYLAHCYCNTYCAYGPVYFKRIWKDVWRYSHHHAVVGIERNGYAFRAMQNQTRRAEFRAKYRDSKTLVFFPPAPDALLNRLEVIEEVVRAIAEFQIAHPDWVVIMRPRPGAWSYYARLMARFGIGAGVLLDKEFSTYELIMYSDVVVAANLSTVGIEAICAGRERVLFMNCWGNWRHPYRRYSRDLVASTPKELTARLEAWAHGEGGPDAEALQAFRRDFDVGFDGQAQERYKDEMRKLAGLD